MQNHVLVLYHVHFKLPAHTYARASVCTCRVNLYLHALVYEAPRREGYKQKLLGDVFHLGQLHLLFANFPPDELSQCGIAAMCNDHTFTEEVTGSCVQAGISKSARKKPLLSLEVFQYSGVGGCVCVKEVPISTQTS